MYILNVVFTAFTVRTLLLVLKITSKWSETLWLFSNKFYQKMHIQEISNGSNE